MNTVLFVGTKQGLRSQITEVFTMVINMLSTTGVSKIKWSKTSSLAKVKMLFMMKGTKTFNKFKKHKFHRALLCA